ncbi:hypothetical protein WBG78_21125 [Chryseolinea sp. T2]|uniref:hypothetical protein n=1 Tax=Chryseolinea sp. T2 TaxID=3129255 RepID=UPI0030785973
MPKIRNNPILQKVTGTLGETVVIRQTKNGPVMANAPSKPEKYHPTQIASQNRFRHAKNYGNNSKVNESLRAMYATGITKKKNSVYQVALTDYMKAPEIRRIETDEYRGQPGNEIFIYAIDDFRVTSVTVVIISAAGKEIERGEAVLSERVRDFWIYTTRSEISSLAGTAITATAKDTPGNSATRTFTFDI